VAKCVHLICRNEDESGWGCKHLVSLKSEVEPGWWETGQWLFSNEEADSLKDGLIFLHHFLNIVVDQFSGGGSLGPSLFFLSLT